MTARTIRARRLAPLALALAAFGIPGLSGCGEDPNRPPDDVVVPGPGFTLYRRLGCNVCHSLNGTRGIGPSFKGEYGQPRELADGTTAVMDDAYIRSTLVDKKRAARAGFDPRVMPNYRGRIAESDVKHLIELIRALQ